MHKKNQGTIAIVFALLSLIGISILGYFAFIFPKTIAVWEEQGRAISVVEKLMVNFSQFCTSFGLIFIPLIAVIFLSSITWLVISIKNKTIKIA